MVIGAHPNYYDIDAGKTAIQFAKLGHNLLFVSPTNGDSGHQEKGGFDKNKNKKIKRLNRFITGDLGLELIAIYKAG